MSEYQIDFDAYTMKKSLNDQLSEVKEWDELKRLLRLARSASYSLASKRRPGVIIYHIQRADIKRNGQDLAIYLVNDGVHAGATAVPNIHKFFFFRLSLDRDKKTLANIEYQS